MSGAAIPVVQKGAFYYNQANQVGANVMVTGIYSPSNFIIAIQNVTFKEFKRALKHLCEEHRLTIIDKQKYIDKVLYGKEKEINIYNIEYHITDIKDVRKKAKSKIVESYKLSIK